MFIGLRFFLGRRARRRLHIHNQTRFPPRGQGLKYVTKDENGGRRITKEGQTALDQIAASVANREDDE